MEEVTKFILELYQVSFISSILFFVYIIGTFFIKLYGRIKQNLDTKFILTKTEKTLFWISIAVFISYLI
jgi:hypothetical protein